MIKTAFRSAVLVAAALAALVSTAGVAVAADEAAGRAARWTELRQSVFGNRAVANGADVIELDTPVRAEDASLVPVGLKTSKPGDIKGITLFIDDNPSPVAARISFGPAADPSVMNLRTRVNVYSNVHAVAETADGKLFETVKFVKASGGCSAPGGGSDEEAMMGAGQMRLKIRDEAVPGKTVNATLLIRHPNFTGMQMNQVSRTYTPARYIKEIKVTYNDKDVFRLEGDISISANPVIDFGLKAEAKGQVKVVATDTADASWEKTFDVPTQSN